MKPRILLTGAALFFMLQSVHADDWPQWLGPKRDGVWRETGILEKFPASGAKVLWRKPVDQGYSGPAVAGDKVFVTDWVRSPKSKEPGSPFAKPRLDGIERILCFDAKTGAQLWVHEYPCPYEVSYAAGPRCTPVVDGDKVYNLGAMGDLVCLDIGNKGKVIWQKNLPKLFDGNVPFWGFAGHPLVDGDRIICLACGQGSIAAAFNKNTGEVIWKNLTASEPGYAPPMIYDIGGTRQLILWHAQSVNGMNPENGDVYWSHPFVSAVKGKGKNAQLGAGMSIPTPRLDGNHLFLTCFYDGSLMLKLQGTKKPEVVWKGKGLGESPEKTDGLHCVMDTPYIKDGHIYGVCSYGETRCIKAGDGERLWESFDFTTGKSQRWGNAFLVPQGDRTILFNELGDLIIAKFTPEKGEIISKVNILKPTNKLAGPPGRRVIWSHPAFAHRCVFARNDQEIICVSMAAKEE